MDNNKLQLMTIATLETQNRQFSGTTGVSQNNRPKKDKTKKQ